MNSFSILISDEDISSLIMPSTLDTFTKYIPKNRHVVWDDNSIKHFISNNFDESVLNAYVTLRPYAYKADLASYCILSKLGGLYSAITNELLITPTGFEEKELIIFRDIQRNSKTSWAVACQLIYAKKNNPVFDRVINKIVNNVKNKYYGHTPLCVTGPAIFGQAVAEIGDIASYSIGDFEDGDQKVFRLENGDVLANYKKLDSGVVGIKGTNNYNDLWYDKNVYGEKENK